MRDVSSRQAGMTIDERERLVKVETTVNHISVQMDDVIDRLTNLSSLADQGRGGLRVLLLVAGGGGGLLGTAAGILAEWLMRK